LSAAVAASAGAARTVIDRSAPAGRRLVTGGAMVGFSSSSSWGGAAATDRAA
jgi:hypothetical protein